MQEGRRIFRFDTFGDEVFWTGVLRMNEPLSQVSPRTALAVGLKVDVDALPAKVDVDALPAKVDVDALPAKVVADLKAGRVNLDDPAVTLALLRLDAVRGRCSRAGGRGSTTRSSTST